jgi:hypothetical protein
MGTKRSVTWALEPGVITTPDFAALHPGYLVIFYHVMHGLDPRIHIFISHPEESRRWPD